MCLLSVPPMLLISVLCQSHSLHLIRLFVESFFTDDFLDSLYDLSLNLQSFEQYVFFVGI